MPMDALPRSGENGGMWPVADSTTLHANKKSTRMRALAARATPRALALTAATDIGLISGTRLSTNIISIASLFRPKCNSTSYYDSGVGKCTNCTICGAGEAEAQPCSESADRVCKGALTLPACTLCVCAHHR
jgi:hypothetical protein